MHDLTCTACSGAIEGLLVLFNTGISYDAFSDAAVAVCNLFLDEFVCQGALNNYFVSNICDSVTNTKNSFSMFKFFDQLHLKHSIF